jgi:hypothetical protein
MATVISHIHFCLRCNDTWTCVSWACEDEDGQLTCQACCVKSSERVAIEPDAERLMLRRSRLVRESNVEAGVATRHERMLP